MAPRPALLLAVLAGAASLAGPSAAQVEPCTLAASVAPATAEHLPGQTLPYNFTVLAGQLGGQVAVEVERATPGWNATLGEDAFALAGGDERTVVVQVTAPADRNLSVASVVVAATLTCSSVPGGPALGTGEARQTLTPFLAQVGPIAPVPEAPGLGLALLGLVGVVLLVAGLLVARRAQPLHLAAPAPRRDVPAGGGAAFPLVLTNRGRQPLTARLDPSGAPAGWKVLPPPAEVPLAPGASSTVQLLLRSPADARPGDAATLEVRLTAPGARPAAVTLQAFVVGEGASEAPAAPPPRRGRAPARPAVVVRDEASLEDEGR